MAADGKRVRVRPGQDVELAPRVDGDEPAADLPVQVRPGLAQLEHVAQHEHAPLGAVQPGQDAHRGARPHEGSGAVLHLFPIGEETLEADVRERVSGQLSDDLWRHGHDVSPHQGRLHLGLYQLIAGGALLDAEILADVYLAMTGGQAALSLESAAASAAGGQRIESRLDRAGLTLVVQEATVEEQAAHEAALDRIEQAVLVGKPSPPFFATAADALGVARHRIAVVGDSLETDVGGGQSVGCLGVAVRTGVFREEQLADRARPPDAVLDSIADLPRWLGL